MSEVAAVILGAGLGRRLGRGPKAFIPYNGATLLDHAVWLLQTAGVRQICAVLPPEPDPVDLPQGIVVARNPDADSGPLASVLLGMAELDASMAYDRLVIHHVDHPHVELEDLDAVLTRSREELEGVSRVVPSWEGKGGHPIVILEPGLNALHSEASEKFESLKDLLGESGDSEYVDAQNSGVVLNWNTPRDFGFIECEEN